MEKTIAKEIISQSSILNKEKKYWLSKLSGELLKASFPYDKIDPAHGTHATAFLDFKLPAEISLKLARLTNNADINLFLVLLSGVNALLYKYTGKQDISIAIPIFKQNHEAHFINSILVARNQFAGNTPFRDLLLQVKQTVFEANEYLNYPIEKLLYHLDIPEPAPGQFPLSDIAVLFQNIHSRDYIKDITFNIIFSFLKTGENIEGLLEYNPALFRNDTIGRIILHFINLLQQVSGQITQPLDEIDILSFEERQRILFDLNDTVTEYPLDKTIKDLFEEQVKKTPGKIAVLDAGPSSSQNRLSYEELNKQANRLARVLRKKGIGPDTIVGIMTIPAITSIMAIMAVLKAGGAYLPIDPETPPQRVMFMLADSQSEILLSPLHQVEYISFAGEIIYLDDSLNTRKDDSNLNNSGNAANLVYIIYTSGTTGKPKGVLSENRNLVNYVSWFSRQASLTKNDRTILMTSLAFDLGYTAVYPALLNGCEFHILAREVYLYAAGLLNYIRNNGITYIKLTPSLFSLIVNSADFSENNFQSVRLLVLGGEEINLKDVKTAHRTCGHLQIMNHYGPTENTVGSVARFIDFDKFEEYLDQPTIGKPIHNARVYILAKNLKILPIGIPGELCIAGAGLTRGYLNCVDLTCEKFITNPLKPSEKIYKTGDLARYSSDGNIEFLGRTDHQVNIRGFRVEPGEIESRLHAHGEIKEAVVIPKEGERGNKYICAYLVADKPLNFQLIREYLLRSIPDYMIPSYFVQMDKIPLTTNGKLDMKALPDPIIATITTTKNFSAPRNEIEKKLATIWSTVLSGDGANASQLTGSIGINDNFFDLGGNSLDIIMVGNKLKESMGKEIPIVTMFKYPTIAALAEYLSPNDNAETIDRKNVDNTEALNKSRDVMKRTLARNKGIKG